MTTESPARSLSRFSPWTSAAVSVGGGLTSTLNQSPSAEQGAIYLPGFFAEIMHFVLFTSAGWPNQLTLVYTVPASLFPNHYEAQARLVSRKVVYTLTVDRQSGKRSHGLH